MTQGAGTVNATTLSSIQELLLAPAKILVIDDDALVLNALTLTLQREGYDVISAQNGAEALRILREEPVALIICDQRMPGMSGLEVLQQAQRIQPDAMRIALTGNAERETVIDAINIGQVTQFLTKPWEDIVLRQTVKTLLEKFRLFQENRSLQQLLIGQNRELEKINQTLIYERVLGGRIHEELLLGKVPIDVPGLSIAATTVPSKEIDGDFIDFYRPVPHFVDVVIGDVMGKGIPAALVGTAIKTQLLRFAVPLSHVKYCDKDTFWLDDILSPSEIMSRAHEEIARQLIELEFFVTLFYGRFDLIRKTFTYIDCGSTKPLHYRSKDASFNSLRGEDFPVGMVEQNSYHQLETTFDEDDIFVFYSDGVTESRSSDNGLYGTDRLASLIKANARKDAEEILQEIRKSVLEHAGKDRFDDDLTLIVVKISIKDHYQRNPSLSAAYLNDMSQLHAIRSFIKRICDSAPGDKEALRQMLELAIDEAFCNIVKHGYKEDNGKSIYLRAQYQQEGLLIELSDQGIQFKPELAPEPCLAGNEESGYGLFIIRQIADKLAYIPKSTPEGWNHLRIFKRYIFKEVPMELSHTTQDRVLVITPTGPSLDAKEARDFKDKIISLIGQNDSHAIVVDMKNLQFIDSSGLGTFLSILKTLHAQNGELKLANLNKPIRTIFELVSMHKIFEIYNTVEDAVLSFK